MEFKFSQPMATGDSSSSVSGVPAKIGDVATSDSCIRGGKPPRASLLDKQTRVESVSFVIPQTPRGKTRHSTVPLLRCGKCQRQVMGHRESCSCGNKQLYFLANTSYTPAEQKEYERFVALCAQQAMSGKDKFVGPVGLWLKFCFPIPESRKKKLKEGDWHSQRPDRDNNEKSIMDGCNGVVWADDCIVCFGMQTCIWTEGVPRTEVIVRSLEGVTSDTLY